ncbi:MAG TPA: deoxyribodipyrimidine photo-lyase [Gemmatales bacterium]|nr:deoxyribodipyrimidine photo-lyase [Gemmatales bacterium]
MAMRPAALVWFRHDLRLDDQPALRRALVDFAPIPVFIWAPEEEAPWPPGAASRWWLHHSLAALDQSFQERGLGLVLRQGSSLEQLKLLIQETGAKAVFWNRRYEPAVVQRDQQVKSELRRLGLVAESFGGSLLFEPAALRTQQDKPYQVFTPFHKACLAQPAPPRPVPLPASLPKFDSWPASVPLAALQLLPQIAWDAGMKATWNPGESGAWTLLRRFETEGLTSYLDQRDRPDLVGTSRLSPHLHFGEISPHRLWWTIQDRLGEMHSVSARRQAEGWLRQLVWREFAHHLLFQFPHTATAPLRPEFEAFPWLERPDWLRAWQRGQTGYPLVDAGMRELWTTGWMHNRVRMNVASLLVKHLRIHWLEGARWFWDTLVDADLANNTLGWQWTAGCGADAAPYFRIFNPMLQAAKFDPSGAYIARWVPEVAGLPLPERFDPLSAKPGMLATEGIILGKSYPRPLVEHTEGRAAALAALATLRS